MKWLIFGHRGWIGERLHEALRAAGQDARVVERRLFRYEDVASAVEGARPDRIVCTVGRTHGAGYSTIDGLEGDDAWADAVLANHDIPVWISRAAREGSAGPIHVLYLGTGCIYSGAGSREFLESDRPNFSGSAYSRIKAMTDLTLGCETHVLNARIRMPISDSPGPRDFVCKLQSYRKICSDGPNSVSLLPEVLPALLALAHEGVVGTYNAVNPGPLTNAEVLAVSRERALLAHAHEEVASPAGLGLLARRSCCVLSCARIQAALGGLPQETLCAYGARRALSDAREALGRTLVERKEPYRMLVTGGCGFIGSHFVDRWLEAFPQDSVVNVDSVCEFSGSREDNPRAADPGAPEELRSRYRHLNLDLSLNDSERRLTEELLSGRITHVVHFAARTHVDESFDGSASMDFLRTNVLGTHRLLEACRQYRDAGGVLERFVHVSTDEVYGDRRGAKGPADAKRTTLEPTNPYAASKASAEMLIKSYHSSYGIPCVVVRCNNAYGPRQFVTKVVAKFCTLALRGERLPLHGGGHARRHFVHVRDAAEAIGLLLRSGEADGRAYNIAGDQEVSAAELAENILMLAGRPVAGGTLSVPDRPYNDQSYHVCDAELRSFGWRQTVALQDGLVETLRWYAEREL